MERKNNNDEMEIDLLELMGALWKKIWAIILATVMFAAAALAGTVFFVAPKYEAQALMYVNSTMSVGSKLSISMAELNAAQSLIDTYSVILKTRATLNDVIAETGVNYSYEDLVKMISAESVNGTEIFAITVTSTSPQEAEQLANTIAEILPDKIASIVEGSSVRIVDYAVTPAHKASPSLSKNTLIGGLLGLVLMCGVVVVQFLMDDQIHDSDYLKDTYNIPVLAVIPDLLTSKSENEYYRRSEQQTKKGR